MKIAARRLVEEAWGKGDLTVLDEVCAPDYVVGEDGNLQSLKDTITEYRQGLPDFKLIISVMIAEGSWVAYRWTMTGTHRGEYQGIAPTGKRVRITGMTMLLFADGKIVQDVFEVSSKDFKEQIA